MWAILDMWQDVAILVAILDFETLMRFMYDFENYINELNVPQKHTHFGIYLKLIVSPKCWEFIKSGRHHRIPRKK